MNISTAQLLNNPNVKKIFQVTEDVQKPIHVPFFINNECYIITQQDVRRIEDTRFLTYNKIGPKGEILPVQTMDNDAYIRAVLENAYNCSMKQRVHGEAPQPMQTENLPTTASVTQSYIPIHPTATVASVQQQLHWMRGNENSSVPFPMTYATSTSTTELTPQKPVPFAKVDKICQCNSCILRNQRFTDSVGRITCCSSTCTVPGTLLRDTQNKTLSAQEQRKQRKIRFVF